MLHEMLPEAVHHHAGGEGILRAGDPAGQRQSTAGAALIRRWRDVRRVGIEHGKKSRRHAFLFGLIIPLLQNVRDGNVLHLIPHLEILRKFHRSKEGAQPVVIRLRHGIEFVIMAATATHRQSQECAGRGLCKISEQFRPRAVLFVGIARSVVVGTQPEVSGGHLVFPHLLGRHLILHQFIAGELFDDKLIVGLVGIERPDDIVAVFVGQRPELIPIESVAITVTHHIQPLAGDVFAEKGRGEQCIRQCRSRLWQALCVGFGKEGGHLLRSWRQTSEVEIQPSGQHARVGRRWCRRPLRLKIGQHQTVDFPVSPGIAGWLRQLRLADLLQRPKVEALTVETHHHRIADIGPSVADALRRLRRKRGHRQTEEGRATFHANTSGMTFARPATPVSRSWRPLVSKVKAA